MRTFTSLTSIPANFGSSAVTIGKFDGIHLGHQRIIKGLLAESRPRALIPTVVTFDRNPLSVLAPTSCPPSLVSNAQKLELLDALGVEATAMLTFDRPFSELPPEQFVTDVLVDGLHATVVFVGRDFRFGARGAGDVALLDTLGERHGFEIRHCDSVEHDGRRVSSTWVRELLGLGDVRGAAALLGRRPVVRGVIVGGAQRGRALGFPTANLGPQAEGLAPSDGVYAAWAIVAGSRLPAAVSIGNNPTFTGVAERQVEAYLLAPDFGLIDLNLYGETVELHFVERIRGMVAFSDVDALVVGIQSDVERVTDILRSDS